MAEIPTTLSEVEPAWLTAALRAEGHDVPDVTDVAYEPFPGNVGVLGEIGVLTVAYAGETDLPERFVGKCPLDDDTARVYNQVMRYYRREAGFYRDLADEVPMRVPRCYLNVGEGDQNLLLLEYLDDATPGDVLVGTSFDAMRRLIGDMARLHARYWLDERIRELDWMFTFPEPSLLMGFDVVKHTWPIAVEAEPDLVPDDLKALVEGPYLEEIPRERWIETYDARPWTLIHGDYELENILFEGDEPVIVDWQGVMAAFPGMDLGFSLAISGTDETVERERELLDHYRAELAAAGGPEWSHDELVDDLAWAMMFFVPGQTAPFIQDFSAMGEQGERLERRMKASWRDIVAAAIRWETVERVTPPA